jgi:hypothetical protein
VLDDHPEGCARVRERFTLAKLEIDQSLACPPLA